MILRVDENPRSPASVKGDLKSRYGRQSFSGWLELLGHLEALVDRARADPAPMATRHDRGA